MIYSHFYRHNSFCTVFWVSSFYLSVNIVLYQFTVTCIENWSVRSLGQWIMESKVYLLIIHARTEKKGSRLRLCFWVVDEVPEKNEWICESRYMSSSKCLFACICGILFALKPFCDYSLCSVCIFPQPASYSQSVVCILHSVCILPLVRSLQSAVRSLRFTLTDNLVKEHNYASQKADTPRLRSRTQNIFSVISISAVILKLMVKITSIFVSYRFLRMAWH